MSEGYTLWKLQMMRSETLPGTLRSESRSMLGSLRNLDDSGEFLRQ